MGRVVRAIVVLAGLTRLSGVLVPGGAPVAAQDGGQGTLVIRALDEHKQPLPGACFELDTPEGAFARANLCDVFDGAYDGSVTVADAEPGDYVLLEVVVPPGYLFAKQRTVRINAGQTTGATVRHKPGGQSLVVSQVDETGAALPGACFGVYEDLGDGVPGTSVAGTCDFFDEANDGTTVVAGLLPGTYLAIESYTPEGYGLPPGQAFAIATGEDAALSFAGQPGGATLTVVNVGDDKEPVPGACFRVYADAGKGTRGALVTVSCDPWDTANDGKVEVRGLLPGKYVLGSTYALPGHALPADRTLSMPAKAKKVTITHPPAAGTPSASPAPAG